jgi:glycosyltransferase involved in cell wall biosynthesis
VSLARHFPTAEPAGVVLCAPHFHASVLKEAARLMPVYVARAMGDAHETRRLLERACATADVLVTWGIPQLAAVTHDLTLPVVDVSHSDGAWAQQSRMVARASDGADFHIAVSGGALTAFPPEIRRHALVIYNGAEVDRVAPRRGAAQQRAGWGIEPGERVALFLGRFDPVKAPLRLVAALADLPPHWHAVFHGHGPLERELRARAASAGRRCRVLAPVAHVGDALAAADVLVLPSDFEGMSLTLVEAFLAGTPVVATPLRFLREAYALHGPLCELVPTRPSGAQLARGITRAAERNYVARAHDVAWKHYTAAAMAQRWEEFLRAAVRVWRQEVSDDQIPMTNDQTCIARST